MVNSPKPTEFTNLPKNYCLTIEFTANCFGQIGMGLGLGRASSLELRASRHPYRHPSGPPHSGMGSLRRFHFPPEDDAVHQLQQQGTEAEANELKMLT